MKFTQTQKSNQSCNHSVEKVQQNVTTSDEARLDIAARGFWQKGEIAFFDVRVFNPYAKSLRNQQIQSIFNAQEREKKRTHNQRVIQVEHGSFSPLVFSCYGGHGQETERVLSTLVTKISQKRGVPRSEIAKHVRTKISFCLVRSSTTCSRGTRRPLKQHMKKEKKKKIITKKKLN